MEKRKVDGTLKPRYFNDYTKCKWIKHPQLKGQINAIWLNLTDIMQIERNWK